MSEENLGSFVTSAVGVELFNGSGVSVAKVLMDAGFLSRISLSGF